MCLLTHKSTSNACWENQKNMNKKKIKWKKKYIHRTHGCLYMATLQLDCMYDFVWSVAVSCRVFQTLFFLIFFLFSSSEHIFLSLVFRLFAFNNPDIFFNLFEVFLFAQRVHPSFVRLLYRHENLCWFFFLYLSFSLSNIFVCFIQIFSYSIFYRSFVLRVLYCRLRFFFSYCFILSMWSSVFVCMCVCYSISFALCRYLLSRFDSIPITKTKRPSFDTVLS